MLTFLAILYLCKNTYAFVLMTFLGNSIIRVIKSKMGWAEHVELMGKTKLHTKF
jgi:hypothetical protein